MNHYNMELSCCFVISQPTMAFYNMSGYIKLNQDGLPRETNATRSYGSKITGRYIATSLYNRLLPRWHYLQLKPNENQPIAETLLVPSLEPDQSNQTKIIHATIPPLHLLAGANDEVFCKQLNLPLKDYLLFKKNKGPQLMFNTQFEIWLQTGRPIIVNQEP